MYDQHDCCNILQKKVDANASLASAWRRHCRQQKYKQLYACINVGEAPLKILKLSDTRWLSIAPCVDRVVDQFNELKLHFQLAKDQECNYTAELLFQMYSDVENRLYLVFLQPILREVNRVNKLFELESTSPVKLLDELVGLYRDILRRIMRPVTFSSWLSTLNYDIYNESNHLPLAAVDFGVAFMMILADHSVDHDKTEVIKLRCRNYMFELLCEMQRRLPSNVGLPGGGR
jgi:hypothetical protein